MAAEKDSPSSWEQIAKDYQTRRASLIPSQWKLPTKVLYSLPINVTEIPPLFLTARENELTSCTASELARKIANRQATSLEVTLAFCHRAAIAQQLVNCLTEIFFDDAIEHAKKLDRILSETGKVVGPLHGVPVSIKDHFDIKGLETTGGYVSYARNGPMDQDALAVDILKKAGAVLYVKTNNPQCMMVLETVSNIYGRTVNPYSTKMGAGGSSGGEGALLALRGSPLGLGSDVGGSIRVPAAFNGLYGFKPSGRRVPTSGWGCANLGQESITAVSGPLGHSIEDLELFFQVISDAEPWLHEPLLEIPWKSGTELDFNREGLTIGLMLWDEVVMPHPYLTRTLKSVAARLQAAGHEVVDFKPYDHKRAWTDILLPLYFPDGAQSIKAALKASREPMLPSAKELIDDPIVKSLNMHELWKYHVARDNYRTEYLEYWNSTAKLTRTGKPIDVIICAPCCVQGTPHDVKPWWGYCSQWNLLDYPSGVIPAGQARIDDKYPDTYKPVNALDEKNFNLYDSKRYEGMPVAIQVVGRTLQDEKVMKAMSIIDGVINGKDIALSRL